MTFKIGDRVEADLILGEEKLLGTIEKVYEPLLEAQEDQETYLRVKLDDKNFGMAVAPVKYFKKID